MLTVAFSASKFSLALSSSIWCILRSRHSLCGIKSVSPVMKQLKRGKDNNNLLADINFDQTKLATAATTSQEMGQLLAAVNGERDEGNISRLTRDKAFTYLKEAVDEIRWAGRYVFWKDSNKVKGYRSKYQNK